MFTDPIADMLTRIRNAFRVNRREVVLPSSKMKMAIAELLVKEGYLEKAVVEKEGIRQNLRLNLKYANNQSVIREVKKISVPSRRVYASYTELPRVLNDMGMAIISTSKGLMSNKEARKRHLGGEVICEIY